MSFDIDPCVPASCGTSNGEFSLSVEVVADNIPAGDQHATVNNWTTSLVTRPAQFVPGRDGVCDDIECRVSVPLTLRPLQWTRRHKRLLPPGELCDCDCEDHAFGRPRHLLSATRL